MTKERKLVTIRKIKQLLPIKGADRIELAVIDGWTCIVKKGEFKVSDLCVYFEIDSVIPAYLDKEQTKLDTKFTFLGKSKTYNGVIGYRIKTMKMRGALSQGLALPLSLFPQIWNAKVGDHVTNKLGVVKYDPEVLLNSGGKHSKPKGNFPSFIPKTDQDRIQNKVHLWETAKDQDFEITVKLDGSSCTMYKLPEPKGFFQKLKSFFFVKQHTFGICSRNLELKETEGNQFWKAARMYGIEAKLPAGYAIQGELLAPNIQANYEKVSQIEYYVFDVFNITKGEYLSPKERRKFCNDYGINHVPVISRNTRVFNWTLQELLDKASGESLNPDVKREGIVCKSNTSSTTFKVISNGYLLKKG